MTATVADIYKRMGWACRISA